MSERRRVTDEELSDLIDGRLETETKAEIEREMERDEGLARRYAILLEQDRLLSQLGEEILSEPVPDRLRSILDTAAKEPDGGGGRGAPEAGRNGPARGPQIMILVAGIAAGIAGGWFGHAALRAQDGGLFHKVVEQAAISHRLLEITAEDRIAELGDAENLPVAALPDLFQTPVRAPVLRGSRWMPVALRTEAGSGGNAMQIAYADQDGEKVTLYVRRVDESDDLPSNLVEAEGYNVLYWLDGPLLYALIGKVGETELGGLARDVYASRAVGGQWPKDSTPAAANTPAAD